MIFSFKEQKFTANGNRWDEARFTPIHAGPNAFPSPQSMLQAQ